MKAPVMTRKADLAIVIDILPSSRRGEGIGYYGLANNTGHPSLLAALESHNIDVEYQCRAGYCGSCRTRLVSGQVDWLTEPLAFIQPGEILPCCCRAKGDIEIEM